MFIVTARVEKGHACTPAEIQSTYTTPSSVNLMIVYLQSLYYQLSRTLIVAVYPDKGSISPPFIDAHVMKEQGSL